MSDTSLIEWIMSLLRDSDARDAFLRDPDGYARDHGFGDLSADDVHDSLCLISDNDHAHSDHGVHYPYPRHHDSGHHGGHDDHGDHDNGSHYLRNYITNNYTTIDEHNTYLDNSVHQDVDTHGGDFHQTIDNDPVVASGEGSVAAGHDIRDSTLTTGHGNVVGDGNQAVTGDHDTAAFGSGSANSVNASHSHFGDGSGLSVGGDAHGHNEDNDTSTSVSNHGSGSTAVNASGDHGHAAQGADQHESDSSSHSHYTDDSSSDSHNDYNSHNSGHLSDSHDVDVHHV